MTATLPVAPVRRPSLRFTSLVALVLLAIGAGTAGADFSTLRTEWINFDDPDAQGYIRPNIMGGQVESDFQGSQDPTNGGAAVSPATADLASNGNPGPAPTSYYGYYDGGTPWNPLIPSTADDDYIFFRMRISADPTTTNGFVNNHYNILIDVDGDGYKEYWVDLEGSYTGGSGTDRLRILYEDLPQQTISDQATAMVNFFTAANEKNGPVATSHTRAYPVPDASGQWWIEFQVPLWALVNQQGVRQVRPDTPIGFAFTTGASNVDPLQKDWASDYTGGIPYDPNNPIIFSPPIVLQPPAIPSANPTDGKFVVLAGRDLDTFNQRKLTFFIGIPAGETQFTFDIFDGDGGNQSPWHSGHWDWFTTDTRFELFADPGKVNSGGGTSVGVLFGNQANTSNGLLTVTEALMPDNAWYRVTVPTDPMAMAPSGNYFYRLDVTLVPTEDGSEHKAFQAFKLRASANTTLSVHGLVQFMAPISTIQDYRIIYPNDVDGFPPLESTDPLVNGRTYDGVWLLCAYLASGVTSLELWDGDFDYRLDTDDPNTPNTVPWFAAGSGALPEGANVPGIPPDDYGPQVSWRNVSPDVRIIVHNPTHSQAYPNLDPSGNGEFELFKIGTSVHTDADLTAPGTQLDPGWWHIHFSGMDINNLNALYVEGELFSHSHAPLLDPSGAITGFMTAPTTTGIRTLGGSTTATIEGQVVVLRGVNSIGEAVVATTTTDARGVYRFDGLVAGRYELFVGDAVLPSRNVMLNAGEVRKGVNFSAAPPRGDTVMHSDAPMPRGVR